METTSPSLKPDSKPETLERKIERWAKMLGEHAEENHFYRLLKRWLKDECQSVEIWFDENPYLEEQKVYGADHINYGRAHYINEIICGNTVYELDIEYTIYVIYNDYGIIDTTIIHSVDNVSVRKIEERAGE